MRPVVLNYILDCDFQCNPACELTCFDRLSPDHQSLLKNLTADPHFYGVLLPRHPDGPTIKAIDRKTAFLLQSLAQSAKLPDSVRLSSDVETNRSIALLVFHGALEIQHEGQFSSGIHAYAAIYPKAAAIDPAIKPRGLLPTLSRQALEYGQRLQLDSVLPLSTRLYNYNRIPLSASWSSRFSRPDNITDFLGVTGGDPCILRALAKWVPVDQDLEGKPWLQWRSRHGFEPGSLQRKPPKLYVSPQPEALPAAFKAVLESLDDRTALSFKVACTPVDMLRPDKLVIYFCNFIELSKTAERIRKAIHGCAVQGVPFTSPIGDEDGLLSWGVDPDADEPTLPWSGRESWRSWITSQLAVAIIDAGKQAGASLEPWQFALECLRLEGIDPDTWTPNLQTPEIH